MKRYILILLSLLAMISCHRIKDGEHVIHILTTNDVHGRYFDSLYVDNSTRPSLLSISAYVDSLRTVWGEDNVVLIDAGDCLQGDNASFYYNFIDTDSTHLYARMVDYIGYDAVVVGNHDIETGHPVYDRVRKDMKTPFLAANAIDEGTGKSYFEDYVILRKGGVKVAVIGFTLTFGAFVYDHMTVSVGSVDNGQTEAAYALGYTKNKTFFRIIFPQAMSIFLPSYCGQAVELIKATAVVGYIAVNDLTKMGDIIRSNTYEAFFPLIATAVIYFLLTWALSLLLKLIKLRFEPKRRKKETILKGVKTK